MATGSGQSPDFNVDSQLEDRFDRHTILDNTRIVSKCKRCGLSLVGSVVHGLAEQERAHVVLCDRHKPPASALIS